MSICEATANRSSTRNRARNSLFRNAGCTSWDRQRGRHTQSPPMSSALWPGWWCVLGPACRQRRRKTCCARESAYLIGPHTTWWARSISRHGPPASTRSPPSNRYVATGMNKDKLGIARLVPAKGVLVAARTGAAHELAVNDDAWRGRTLAFEVKIVRGCL